MQYYARCHRRGRAQKCRLDMGGYLACISSLFGLGSTVAAKCNRTKVGTNKAATPQPQKCEARAAAVSQCAMQARHKDLQHSPHKPNQPANDEKTDEDDGFFLSYAA